MTQGLSQQEAGGEYVWVVNHFYLMIMAVAGNFDVHWCWVVNVSRRFFQVPEQVRRVALQSKTKKSCRIGHTGFPNGGTW